MTDIRATGTPRTTLMIGIASEALSPCREAADGHRFRGAGIREALDSPCTDPREAPRGNQLRTESGH